MYKIFNLLLASLAVFALAGCGAGSTAVVSLTSITIAPANQTITIGTPISFTPTGKYSNGTSAVLEVVGITWTSSNTSVATVDTTGNAFGVTAGTATITATLKLNSSLSASTLVTVK